MPPTAQHKMDEHSCCTATSDAIHSIVLTKHPVLPILRQIKKVLKSQNCRKLHVLKKSISMVHVFFIMCFQLNNIWNLQLQYSFLPNNCTIHNKPLSIAFQCAAYMFQPLNGHPHGGLKQRYIIMTDSVRDVHMWRQKYNVLITIAQNT